MCTTGTSRCAEAVFTDVQGRYCQVCRSGNVDPVADYLPRLADRDLAVLLAELPALLLTGPRATGKTTTAARYAATVVRLDRPAEAVAYQADPDVALRGLPEPVLLDEWQAVPEVLGAVKRAVDTDPRPGRFLVTGSVRADLEAEVWPGTGRVVRVPVHGLTEREVQRRHASPLFLDRLASQGDVDLTDVDAPDLRGYVDLALRGGFPDPVLRLTGRTRAIWLDSYVDQLLTRDAPQVEGRARDPEGLRRFLEACALSTAGVVADQTLHEAAGVNRKTGVAYERLLTNLLVLDALPAWTSSRLTRLVRTRKRFLADPALVATALRLDASAVLRDGDLLGRLVETFVLAQLRAEAPFCQVRPRLFHLRQAEGRHEIDVVVELRGGRVLALEVKATAAPRPSDARHLVWLREQLGDRFIAGVLLHTGPRPVPLSDRVFALPIAALWA